MIMKFVKVFFIVLIFGQIANAAERTHMLIPDTKSAPYDTPITVDVCNVVGKSSDYIKSMIDRGYTNKEIKDVLVEAALNSLANTDRLDQTTASGWIAFNMVGNDEIIDNMRSWPGRVAYQMLRKEFPTLTERQLYDAYGGGMCEDAIKDGTTWPVIRIARVPLVKGKGI